MTYTDEYRACIWTSLGEFRYERCESIRHPTDCISVLLSQYYEFILFTNYSHFTKAKTLPGHAIHNGMSSLRETVIVTLGHNNRTIHASQSETHCLYSPYIVGYTVCRYVIFPLMFIVVYRHNSIGIISINK